MAAEDLLVDNGCDGQTVEAIGEGFPQLDIVATLAFIVKSCKSKQKHGENRWVQKANFRSEFAKWIFFLNGWKITINSIYACTLVIAAQQEEIFWIFDFVGEKQANCLERLLSWK